MSLRRALPLLAVTVTVVAAGIGAAPAAEAASNDTVVVNCVGKKVVQPKQIVVTCADAGVAVVDIKWTSWTANVARGSGTLAWNTCLPTDCASGIVQKYPVRITLGRVASAPSISAFTRMTLAFPEGGPAGAETSRYTLDNAQR
jgi:hypothetical protein